MQYIHQMLVSKELGGAGLMALQLAAALRERVKESVAWVPGEGRAAAKAREMGLTLHRYDPTWALTSSRIRATLCNLTVGRLLRSLRPGLIHIYSPSYYRTLLLALKIAQLKTVVHVQLEHEKEELQWALKSPPDVIITCARFLSEYVRSVLPERLQDSQRIVAIPNAVDTEQFHRGDKCAAKAQFRILPKTPLVLMVANLAPHKGQVTALRAAAILRKKGVDAQFWFAGVERGDSKEYTARLHTLVTELDLTDQVQFLGQRGDIPELLRASDCFILPSTAEGLPLSILEAQASGTPVVAAPTAGIPEIVINGKTGFLVGADDADGYAHQIFNLLYSPSIRSEIADCAYMAVLKEYSWKTYVERIWEVYQKLTHH